MAEEVKPEGKVVFQVLNHDRSEMFFGIADKDLAEVLGDIAKDKQGPAKGWKKGEVVQWRPLTEFLPDEQAIALAKELEAKQAPNKFTIIPYVSVQYPD